MNHRPMDSRCLQALDAYGLASRAVAIAPLGAGHIHDTLAVTLQGPDAALVLQRVNTAVFPDPEGVMHNVLRVTEHLRAKALQRGEDPQRATLHFLETRQGTPWAVLPDGSVWRLAWRVPAAEALDRAPSLEAIQAGARAFGRFTADLADFPAEGLYEVLPGFHDTPQRLERLTVAAEKDPLGRAAGVAAWLQFAEARRPEAGFLTAGLESRALPLRVVHHDTKFNNVLMDVQTGEAVCVIDLDTVGAGSPLTDVGDGVRAVALSAEQEGAVDWAAMEAFAQGWLQGVGGMLTPLERTLLPRMPWLLALELGVRFLTDHLEGDWYFRIPRPGLNLERAQAQFRLVEALESRPAAVAALFSH